MVLVKLGNDIEHLEYYMNGKLTVHSLSRWRTGVWWLKVLEPGTVFLFLTHHNISESLWCQFAGMPLTYDITFGENKLSKSDSELHSPYDELVTRLLCSDRDNWCRFLAMKAKGERTLASYSPFLLEKGGNGKSWRAEGCKKTLRSGALLIQCTKKTNIDHQFNIIN